MSVLVLGAEGLLGRALVERGAWGVGRQELDVRDHQRAEAFLRDHTVHSVIFCAAITDVDRCALDPAVRKVNVEAPAWFAERVETWLVSTNYVFDGPGPHGPEDERRPCNAYGRQKAEAEDRVLAAGGHVLRTGWLFGPGGRGFGSRIRELLSKGPVKALEAWPVQPTWSGDVARVLLDRPRGITHAIGRETTTWAEFAEEAAHRWGGRVQRVRELPLGPRPSDATLRPATLPSWRTRLQELPA